MRKSFATRTAAATLLLSALAAPAPAFAGETSNAGGNGGGNGGASAQSNGGGAPARDAEDAPDAGDDRHPSGKDRSVERGPGAQGRSKSDPDGMTNGGADKPGGTGGVDAGDRDGNNGCGNDDDFEDDNRGRCLGRQRRGGSGGGSQATIARPGHEVAAVGVAPALAPAAPAPALLAGVSDVDLGLGTAAVLGSFVVAPTGQSSPVRGGVAGSLTAAPEALASIASAPAGAALLAAAPGAGVAVLGSQVARGSLAATGVNTGLLTATGLGLVLAGSAMGRRRRSA